MTAQSTCICSLFARPVSKRMIEVAAQTREPVLFAAGDTLDAFDTLEATCCKLDLPYALHTQPCLGTRGEQVEYWHPRHGDIVVFTYPCYEEGCPMLDYKQIGRLLNAATLERELQVMERIHRFPFERSSFED